MKIELDTHGNAFWPRCLLDREIRCGDPKTREIGGGPTNLEIVRSGWHVADMCDCPSCPLRCSIRDALAKYEREV